MSRAYSNRKKNPNREKELVTHPVSRYVVEARMKKVMKGMNKNDRINYLSSISNNLPRGNSAN